MSTGLPSGTEDALRRGAIVCVYIAVSGLSDLSATSYHDHTADRANSDLVGARCGRGKLEAKRLRREAVNIPLVV